MKIAIIGGGGVRTPLLAKSIAHFSKDINIDEIVFMDIDLHKLNIFGKISQIAIKKINPQLKVTLTQDFKEAVYQANYIITTIRVGNDDMRILDEKASLKNHVIGQETTGASGLSFAMRSVEVLKNYCRIIKQISNPHVKVFNFTNPAGIVSQTLRDLGYDFCYGICDAPSSLVESIIEIKKLDRDRVRYECFGLNHFSFITSFQYDGEEMINSILHDDDIYEHTDLKFIDLKLMQNKEILFNEYLYYYLYPQEALNHLLNASQLRSEMIKEINDAMIMELDNIDIDNDFDKAIEIYSKWYNKREESYMVNETGKSVSKKKFVFDILDKKRGGYAGVALDFIESVEKKKSTNIVMCTLSHTQYLNKDDVVESSCTISDKGIEPHNIEIHDELILNFILRMKQYERSASKALISHKKDDFIDCLMLNPLVSSYSISCQLIDDFIDINKSYYQMIE